MLVTSLTACTDSSTIAGTIAAPSFDQVAAQEWVELGSRRIFFGHQSVGRNILDGVRDVTAAAGFIPVRIVNADSLPFGRGSGLFEANLGANGDPVGKTVAFAGALDTHAQGGAIDIALHKYCYVDMLPDTDVERLFATYVSEMREVRMRHPATTFVHITMPLTTPPESAFKRLAKQILRRETETDLNVKRNEFNRLLIREYAGREPLFDLARIESTGRDGSRIYYMSAGDTVFTLAPEWTYDGGHLNQEGRERVARELLTFLATLQMPIPAP